MGASKLSIYSESILTMASIAKVFAHPARIAILQYISKQNACICNDIVEEIGLSQSTISQHLQVIKSAGLLKGNFTGKSICYCLNVERFQEFQAEFNTFFNKTKFKDCS